MAVTPQSKQDGDFPYWLLIVLAAAGNFRYFETYNVVALVYFTMTIGLSLALRRLERHLRQKTPGG